MNFKLFWIFLLAANIYSSKCFDSAFHSDCNDDCEDKCRFGRKTDSSGCPICGDCMTDVIIEEDIKLNELTYREYLRLYQNNTFENSTQRGAIRGNDFKWPKSNGQVRVAYAFVKSNPGKVGFADIKKIKNVMKQFEERTCIKFVRKTAERDYIMFNADSGCSSYVGRIGGAQQINLGRGCTSRNGTIIHEIMHALGFWHEHSRPDRDSYIKIQYENIIPGFESNFDAQKNTVLHNTPYDLGSVMQYGGRFFSKNGQPTITRRDNNRPVVAQRVGFSELDVREINERYECQQFLGNQTTTVKPTTIKPSTTTTSPTGGCRDKNENCNFWLNQGYCVGQFRNFMNKTCPKSCGFCTTVVKKPCADKQSVCKSIAKSKNCNARSPTLQKFIKDNCRKSCELCGIDVNSTTATTTTNAITTATTTATTTTSSVPNPTCKDRNNNCQYWKKQGFCNRDHQHYRYMSRTCQYTCEFCSTKPIQTTTPEPISISIPQTSVTCGTITVQDYNHERMLQRIVGGRGVQYGTVPWIVSLRRGNFEFCAGTLINENFVMTAAHCFYEDNTYNPNVTGLIGLAGKHHSEKQDKHQMTMSFSKIIKFPNYIHSKTENDIALMQLKSPIKFTDYIRPACLPQIQGENLSNHTEAFVSGWGSTGRGGFPDVLQQVEVRTIPNSVCNRWLRNENNRGYDEVTSNMFCAGYEIGKRDACEGDSGGPLTVDRSGQHYVMGIVSWGYGCAEENQPGVYTKVSEKLNWIASEINKSLN